MDTDEDEDDGTDSATDDAPAWPPPILCLFQLTTPFAIRRPAHDHTATTAGTTHVFANESETKLPIITPTAGGDGADNDNGRTLAIMRPHQRCDDAGMMMS